jgi:hypothetical protein
MKYRIRVNGVVMCAGRSKTERQKVKYSLWHETYFWKSYTCPLPTKICLLWYFHQFYFEERNNWITQSANDIISEFCIYINRMIHAASLYTTSSYLRQQAGSILGF